MSCRARLLVLAFAWLASLGCAPPRIACDPEEPDDTCPTGQRCAAGGFCAAPQGGVLGEDSDGQVDAPPALDDDDGEHEAVTQPIGDGYELVLLPPLDASSLEVSAGRAMFAAALERDGARDAVLVEVAAERVRIETLAAGAGSVVPAFAFDGAGRPCVAVFDVDPPQARWLRRTIGGDWQHVSTKDLEDFAPRAGDRPGIAALGEYVVLAVSGHDAGVGVFSYGGVWYTDIVLGAEQGAGSDARVLVDGATIWVAWRSFNTVFSSSGLGSSWFTIADADDAPVVDRVALALHGESGAAAYAFGRASDGSDVEHFFARADNDDEAAPLGASSDESAAIAANESGFVVVTARDGALALVERPLEGEGATRTLPVDGRPRAAYANASGVFVLVATEQATALVRPAQ